MEEGLKINISADVKQAVSGIKQLESSLLTIAKGAAIAAGGAALFAAKAVFLEPTLKILDQTLGELKDDLINLVDAQRKYNDALQASVSGTGAAAVRIFELVEAVKSGTLNTNQLASAQKELVKANPQFAGAFKDSKVNVDALNTALDATVTKIFNTIKAQSATKILAAEFEKITAQILADGKNLSAFQRLASGAGGRFAGGVGNEISKNNLKNANTALDEFGKRVNEVFEKLKISFDITKPFVEPLKKGLIELDKYKSVLIEIQKIGLEEETKFQRDIKALEEKIRLQTEFNQLEQGILSNLPKQQPGANGINIDGMNFGGSFEPATKEIDKMLISAKQLSDTINNGMNAGIDTFFNALANNQDPFKALTQSLQRMVVELAAAVVKALALQIIMNAIAPGTGAINGIKAGVNAGTGTVVRGNDLFIQIGRLLRPR